MSIYYKNHIYKNRIKDKKIKFYRVSKHIEKIIIKLKAIKYKKDFFYYLFYYLDISPYAHCLQTLFFTNYF